MPFTMYGPKGYGDDDARAFDLRDFSGLVNIADPPGLIADNELAACVNMYGTPNGGLIQRRGTAFRGGLLDGANPVNGLKRFAQLVVGNNPQTPPIVKTLGQLGNSLWDVDAGMKLVNNALGASAQPWSVTTVLDPDDGLYYAPFISINSFPSDPMNGLRNNLLYNIVYTLVGSRGESTPGPPNAAPGFPLPGDFVDIVLNPPPGPLDPSVTNYNVYMTVFVKSGSGSAVQLFTKVNGAPIPIASTFTINQLNLPTLIGTQPPTQNATGLSTDSLVICTGSGGPYLWDGTNLTTPPQWSQVASARWCQSVNGVLWFGGIKAQPNLIWGSQVGHPQLLPSSGTFSLSQAVLGLSTLGSGAQGALVVGHTLGLTVIYGTGESNFYVQEFPHPDGVASGRAMVPVEGVVYYLGRWGIYIFDGSTIYLISTKVGPWIRNDPNYQDFAVSNRQNAFGIYYKDRVYFGYQSNSPVNNVFLVWDTILGGWTVMQPSQQFNAMCTLDSPVDTEPSALVAGDARRGQIYSFETTNGGGPNNHDVSDLGQPIPTFLLTKYFNFEQAGVNKRVQRIYPEIYYEDLPSAAALIYRDYGFLQGNIPLVQQLTGFLWDQAKWDAFGTDWGTALNQGGLNWDQGLWDQSLWGGAGFLQFQAPRVDGPEEDGLAFAFGFITNGVNAPYRFQGISGQYVLEVRN